MVSGLIENLGLVCENEGGDDNEVDTGLADEGRFTPTIDSINVIQTNNNRFTRTLTYPEGLS